MFNPGSLSGDGKAILKDTTLRSLRSLFHGQKFNCLVLNIFDLATPSVKEIFHTWESRHSDFNLDIFKNLNEFGVTHFFFAYGNIPFSGNQTQIESCLMRINVIKKIITDQSITELETIQNIGGNPVHPYRYTFKFPNRLATESGLEIMRRRIAKIGSG